MPLHAPQTRWGLNRYAAPPCADIVQQEVAKGMDDSLLPKASGTVNAQPLIGVPATVVFLWNVNAFRD